jgi:hypothetical protein
MFETVERMMAGAGFLINTAASARCSSTIDGRKLFQQFARFERNPLERLAAESDMQHRAEAAVLMRSVEHSAQNFLATGIYGRVATDGIWTLDLEAAIGALRDSVEANQPVMILGTAFLFVHLLDELVARKLHFTLPAGSRAMETGGYKGRSRVLQKSELHALITQCLGIPATQISSEYGMSELSSQAYDNPGKQHDVTTGRQDDGPTRIQHALRTLRSPRSTPHASSVPRLFSFPPWARVQIISPETGVEVGHGETGLIRVFDLANVYSVMAIQTEDFGIRRASAFELIGRAALAESRGCSLMAQ